LQRVDIGALSGALVIAAPTAALAIENQAVVQLE
jgi:hypothetical protein